LLDRRVDCLSVIFLTFSLPFPQYVQETRQVKPFISWSHQSCLGLAIPQIMVSVRLMTCGPASAKDLPTKSDLPTNATHCPVHQDSHDSQDSQFPDRASLCERMQIGIVLTSLRTDISDSYNFQLVVPHRTLVEPDVFAFLHSSTLLTHVRRSSISPLAGTLRL